MNPYRFNSVILVCYCIWQALWLHRRFLSLVWIKHFATDIHDVSNHSDSKDTTSHEIGIFMDNELGLFRSCSTIPDNDFEDFQAHATFSATYILWLTKVIYFSSVFGEFYIHLKTSLWLILCVHQQISQSLESELQEKLRVGELETVMNKVCPEKILLLRSFQGSESV